MCDGSAAEVPSRADMRFLVSDRIYTAGFDVCSCIRAFKRLTAKAGTNPCPVWHTLTPFRGGDSVNFLR
jgi:hypothetical protein